MLTAFPSVVSLTFGFRGEFLIFGQVPKIDNTLATLASVFPLLELAVQDPQI